MVQSIIGTPMNFDDQTIRSLFGTDTAEDEDPVRLKQYFFRNKSYDNIRTALPLRILVGHKGIGKSALLRMSYIEDQEQGILSLWVQPNDLILENSKELNFLERIAGFKKLLTRSIYRKALDSLGVKDAGAVKVSLANTGKQLLSAIVEKTINSIGADFDESSAGLRKSLMSSREIRVYIDDIDRGWTASRDDISNISALINAARDLTNEDSGLKLRIGLRSDAYFLYRTSDESTDKIESNVIRLNWDRHDVLTVIALRVASYLKSATDLRTLPDRHQREIARELHPIIDERFTVGKGHWDGAPIHTVLLSLNRNRPRDLIKLLTEAGKEAYRRNNDKIKSKDLEAVFANYSHGRITDLCLEFKSELPQIDKLMYNMGPSARVQDKSKRWRYTNDELVKKIRNIRQSHQFVFQNGMPVTEKTLAEFLYKIDFLIARDTGPDGDPRWTHFDQNRMLQSQFVDFGYSWEVHPAYRWALQPKSTHEILESIEALGS